MLISYDDANDISEYAIAPMQYVVASGLIKDKSANSLDNATRAVIAAILQRFIGANK